MSADKNISRGHNSLRDQGQLEAEGRNRQRAAQRVVGTVEWLWELRVLSGQHATWLFAEQSSLRCNLASWFSVEGVGCWYVGVDSSMEPLAN